MLRAIFVIWFISIFFCLSGLSQDRKNAFTLELLGKSFYYFDISYERYLIDAFHVGGGVGISDIEHLQNNGAKYNRYFYSIPFYCGYAFGPGKNHFISELGTTIIGETGPGESTNYSGRAPFISLGYEYKRDNFIFRAPVYLAYFGRNRFFP
jgi:hypothetical protein